MGATTSIIIGMLALLGFFAGHQLTGSYIVAMLFAVIVILIFKSIQPAALVLWDKFCNRFFPLPKLEEFKREGLDPTEDYVIPPQCQGLRVLAMTEELPYEGNQEIYESIVAESLDALCKEYPLFDVRLAAVYRRKLPIQYVWSLCAKDGEQISKCVKAWFRSWAVHDMKARKQFTDLFLHDGNVEISSGETIRYTVMVLFDGELPVTIPKSKPDSES